MDKKYFENYVSVALIVAIIVLLVTIFLSSKAEASHGKYSSPLSDTVSGDLRGSLAISNKFAGLVFEVPRSSFEGTHPPVEFIFQWPRLPTVAEAQIKIAEDRLRFVMSQEAKKDEEVRKALELKVDNEALKKAFALALLSLGSILTVITLSYRKP